MLSRVAENIYWLARYVERAENTARLMGVNANLLLDLPKGIAPGWAPLVAITGSEVVFRDTYQELPKNGEALLDMVRRFSTHLLKRQYPRLRLSHERATAVHLMLCLRDTLELTWSMLGPPQR